MRLSMGKRRLHEDHIVRERRRRSHVARGEIGSEGRCLKLQNSMEKQREGGCVEINDDTDVREQRTRTTLMGTRPLNKIRTIFRCVPLGAVVAADATDTVPGTCLASTGKSRTDGCEDTMPKFKSLKVLRGRTCSGLADDRTFGDAALKLAIAGKKFGGGNMVEDVRPIRSLRGK